MKEGMGVESDLVRTMVRTTQETQITSSCSVRRSRKPHAESLLNSHLKIVFQGLEEVSGH